MTEDTTSHRKSLTANQRRWLEHIKAADASGLTYKEYAAREELSLSSLSYNKSVLRKRGYLADERVTFVPAQVQACPDAPALRVQLPSGIVIEAGASVPSETVVNLVRALT